MPDTPFYREYATQQCGPNSEKGEILELGCGTGRVALALAKDGFRVTGLDLSRQMLDVFREKLAKETASYPELAQRVEIIHGNMADFDIGRKFALITAPYRVFQLLTAGQEAENALSCIREHLADDGIFIINVFHPFANPLDESWCREETFIDEITDEVTGIRIARHECRERIDSQNQIIYPYLAYSVTYPDGSTQRLVEHLQMKYYYRHQLRVLVESAGLEVVDEYAWYDKASRVDEPAECNPGHIPQGTVKDANNPARRVGGREIILVCRRKV